MRPEVLALIAMLAWAGQALAVRGASGRLGPAAVIAIAVAAEVVLATGWLLVGVGARGPGAVGSTTGALMAAAAGVAGIVGYLAFAEALARGPASTAVITALAAAYPVVVMLAARPLFGEVVTPSRLLAVGCLALGTFLALRG